MKISSQHP